MALSLTYIWKYIATDVTYTSFNSFLFQNTQIQLIIHILNYLNIKLIISSLLRPQRWKNLRCVSSHSGQDIPITFPETSLSWGMFSSFPEVISCGIKKGARNLDLLLICKPRFWPSEISWAFENCFFPWDSAVPASFSQSIQCIYTIFQEKLLMCNNA